MCVLGMVAKSPFMPSVSICLHFALRLPASPAIVPKRDIESHLQAASGTSPAHNWALNECAPGGPAGALAGGPGE